MIGAHPALSALILKVLQSNALRLRKKPNAAVLSFPPCLRYSSFLLQPGQIALTFPEHLKSITAAGGVCLDNTEQCLKWNHSQSIDVFLRDFTDIKELIPPST